MRWRLSTLLPWPWRTPPATDPDGWGQRVVDLLAVRLTGSVLGPASNEAALKVLAETPGDPNERAMQIASFVASLPEASER